MHPPADACGRGQTPAHAACGARGTDRARAPLANPDKYVGAEELRHIAAGRPRRVTPKSAGEATDETAVEEVRREIEEVEGALEEAREMGDLGAQARLEEAVDALKAELSSTTGLGSRARLAADDVEKARVAVTRSVQRALDGIRKAHEPLWRHIDGSLDKGRDFIYKPEKPPVWQVDPV